MHIYLLPVTCKKLMHNIKCKTISHTLKFYRKFDINQFNNVTNIMDTAESYIWANM